AFAATDIAARAFGDGANGKTRMCVAGEGLAAERGFEKLDAVVPAEMVIAVARHPAGIPPKGRVRKERSCATWQRPWRRRLAVSGRQSSRGRGFHDGLVAGERVSRRPSWSI